MDPDTGAQNEQHPHSNHQGSDADPTHLQSNALTSSSFSTHNQARADDFKLVQAARSGDLALLKLALKNGASVKDYGPEALREAAGSGNIEILGALLEAGVNPKECPRIVLEAVKTGRLDIVQLIVRSGADVNDYSSPLREAVRSNKKDMVEFLLESGAGKDRWNAISILENAAVFADLPILKLLIDSGRMKSSLDPALFLSVSHGRLDSASLLRSLRARSGRRGKGLSSIVDQRNV